MVQETKNLKLFSASKGCAVNFVKQHELRFVILSGEAASADVTAMADDVAKLRNNLAEPSLDRIFNLDEKGLFYKLLSRRTYIWIHKKHFPLWET